MLWQGEREEYIQKLEEGEYVPAIALGGSAKITLFSDDDNPYIYGERLQTNLGKAFYNLLEENAENFNSLNTGNLVSSPVTYNVPSSYTASKAFQEYVKPETSEISSALYAFFEYDRPDMYFVDLTKFSVSMGYSLRGGVLSVTLNVSSNSGTNYLNDSYNSEEGFATLQEELKVIEEESTKIIEAMPENLSDFAKVIYFTDTISDITTYNPASDMQLNYTLYPKAFNMSSVFVYSKYDDSTKYPVCEGYAEALKYLCDLSGVKCCILTSSSHEWTGIVMGDKIYFADPTWTDNLREAGARNASSAYTYMFTKDDSAKEEMHDMSTNSYKDYITQPTVSDTDYLADTGIKNYTSLDANNDKRITIGDAATELKAINKGKLSQTYDNNSDGNADIIDAVIFTSLMLNGQE